MLAPSLNEGSRPLTDARSPSPNPNSRSSSLTNSEGACQTLELLLAARVDRVALRRIVSNRFKEELPIKEERELPMGGFAKPIVFTLASRQVLARLIAPGVQKGANTTAEVTAMQLARARTKAPIPEVYLYSDRGDNPVGVCFVLMEFMEGTLLQDCRTSLSYEALKCVADDTIDFMVDMFSITATHGGTIRTRSGVDDSFLSLRSLRLEDWGLYKPVSESTLSLDAGASLTPNVLFESWGYLGPISDIRMMNSEYSIDNFPAVLCGPFATERQFMNAFAFRGSTSEEINDKMMTAGFTKVLEVFDVVRLLYRGFQRTGERSSDDTSTTHDAFHFSHGDLSSMNVLVDPTTGRITGIVDWEMAGFRPAWQAVSPLGWFQDDDERFAFYLGTDEPGGHKYADDTPTERMLRAYFRTRLAERSEEVFRHYWLGVELRALLQAVSLPGESNASEWLSRHKDEWEVHRRGPYPFDLEAFYSACAHHYNDWRFGRVDRNGHPITNGTESKQD